jgi:competence protein ComEC
VLAADVGQGHAVLVRTAHQSLLYDTGPRYFAQSDAGQRVLVPLLQSLGERLTQLVVSHQDADHSGGLKAVLAQQPQAHVLTSVPASHPLQTLASMQTCHAGQSWQWDGVLFQVLHPRAVDYSLPTTPNALSCVLRIQSASGRVALLVGDIEAEQERALVLREPDLRADWLLVPHHGSLTSSSAAFLEAVRPRVAVVQAGYRNRFGHPRPEVVARYEAWNVRWVQTPQCGAVTWQSHQPELVQCEREVQKNYWRTRF